MPYALPVTLITGLLGSGKSTLIKNLLTNSPANQHWAVLINEFGEIDIDGKMLQANNSSPSMTSTAQVSITCVSGGCICCTAHLALVKAINQLLKAHPNLDRLIIEPTGLGHPAKIIDALSENHFYRHLVVEHKVCLVSAAQLTPQRWQKSQVMRDLVTLADTVIINKTDLATANNHIQNQEVLAQLYPAKNSIFYTEFAQVETQSILAPAPKHDALFHTFTPADTSVKETLLPIQKQSAGHLTSSEQIYPSSFSKIKACYLYAARNSQEFSSIGWVWSSETQFNRVRLKAFFVNNQMIIWRAKGLLKTGKEWKLLQWADGTFELNDIAWRTDSRLELFITLPAIQVSNDESVKKVISMLEAQLQLAIHSQ